MADARFILFSAPPNVKPPDRPAERSGAPPGQTEEPMALRGEDRGPPHSRGATRCVPRHRGEEVVTGLIWRLPKQCRGQTVLGPHRFCAACRLRALHWLISPRGWRSAMTAARTARGHTNSHRSQHVASRWTLFPNARTCPPGTPAGVSVAPEPHVPAGRQPRSHPPQDIHIENDAVLRIISRFKLSRCGIHGYIEQSSRKIEILAHSVAGSAGRRGRLGITDHAHDAGAAPATADPHIWGTSL